LWQAGAGVVRRLISGPDSVYICDACVSAVQKILDAGTMRRPAGPLSLADVPSPRQLCEALNEYVVGQDAPRRCCP
jgi:ATP-dependent Clp protease ATP-binding subunit ClpX